MLRRIIHLAAVPLLLLALTWIAHFSLSRHMGFYDDDYHFAVRTMAWSGSDLLADLKLQITDFPKPQGRPIGFMLGSILPFVGYRLGGVPGMYIIGFLVESLNAILFYYLLRRCVRSPAPLVGAIAFVLFPADTTREFLNHAHILQPSLTFMLIAGHLYLSGGRKRILSYIPVMCCLLTYESAVLPFLAIPLLLPSEKLSNVFRRCAMHLSTILSLVVLIVVIRKFTGEVRTAAAAGSTGEVISHILKGSIIGPLAACHSYWTRARQGWFDLTGLHTNFICLPVAGVFAAAITFCWHGGLWQRSNEESHAGTRRLFIFGLASLAVSYLFAFTHYPPDILEGRGTSVHLAATVGLSAIIAAAAMPLFQLQLENKKFSLAVGFSTATVTGIYFSLLTGAAIDEQRGYVAIAKARGDYWAQILRLCPDLRAGTIVIVDGYMPQPAYYQLVSTWADCLTLHQLFRFPPNVDPVPRVYSFRSDSPGAGWRDTLQWEIDDRGGHWLIPPYNRLPGSIVSNGNAILLTADSEGNLTRTHGNVDVRGRPLRLKDFELADIAAYPHLPLFDSLIAGRNVNWRSAIAGKFSGYTVLTGLNPEEGPYPQYHLPVTRCGIGAGSLLRVKAQAAGKITLAMNVMPLQENQVIQIRCNGSAITEQPLGTAFQFHRYDLEVAVKAGENQIDLRYVPNASDTKAKTVIYETLLVSAVDSSSSAPLR